MEDGRNAVRNATMGVKVFSDSETALDSEDCVNGARQHKTVMPR